MSTNRSGNLNQVMQQAVWDSATRVPEGDIRALKHRIHALEGEVIGYKQILDAQPVQEPVAFASHGIVNWIADKQFQHEAHLYSAPQRTWVGLTDQEIEDALYDGFAFGLDKGNVSNQTVIRHVIRVIEAKLKEKNA